MSMQIQFEQLFNSIVLFKCTSSTDYFFSQKMKLNFDYPVWIFFSDFFHFKMSSISSDLVLVIAD